MAESISEETSSGISLQYFPIPSRSIVLMWMTEWLAGWLAECVCACDVCRLFDVWPLGAYCRRMEFISIQFAFIGFILCIVDTYIQYQAHSVQIFSVQIFSVQIFSFRLNSLLFNHTIHTFVLKKKSAKHMTILLYGYYILARKLKIDRLAKVDKWYGQFFAIIFRFNPKTNRKYTYYKYDCVCVCMMWITNSAWNGHEWKLARKTNSKIITSTNNQILNN